MVKRPDDIRPTSLYYFCGGETEDGQKWDRVEMYQHPDQNWPPHRVYWGSHGCARPVGHDGPCWCDCCECEDHEAEHEDEGCVAGPPYYGPQTHFYGEDVPGRNVGPPFMEVEIS